jgi:GNAT superfamily N-acetyltransferase
MEFVIQSITEHPQVIPLLSILHVAEWGDLYVGWNEDTALSEFLGMQANDIPVTFVALGSNSSLLGSVSIFETDDLPGFDHLTPWLGSLFVLPEARGAGVGEALLAHAQGWAATKNIPKMYLFTTGRYNAGVRNLDAQRAYYHSKGWIEVSETTANGHPASVMVCDVEGFSRTHEPGPDVLDSTELPGSTKLPGSTELPGSTKLPDTTERS